MNKNYKYDFCVFIGRFSPYHIGHERNIIQALSIAHKVIMVLGSAQKPRTFHDPFSVKERIEYIKACLLQVEEGPESRVEFTTVEDTIYQNPVWVKNVQTAVNNIVLDYFPGNPKDAKVAIIGHEKDESSWYLQNFKNWKQIETGPFIKTTGEVPISATKIRELMFTNYLGYVESAVPPIMYKWLSKFVLTDEFKAVQAEYNADYDYLPIAHENMTQGKWPTNFYTCDAIVIQSGHILLVQRGKQPGFGLWALPGGHINAWETSAQAVIRELKEETKLKVPEKVLLSYWIGERLFDHPNRSLRGKSRSKNCRTITVSHCFKLDDNESLPLVKGSDDASMAWWWPLGDLEGLRDQIFEDHSDIIDYWIPRIED